jgi:protein-arginine kinase activator protein McsA
MKRFIPKLFYVFVLGALSTSWNHDARAQEPDLTRVQQLHAAAQAAAQDGRYVECVQFYSQAQDIAPYAEINFNIAKCYERNDQLLEAMASYEKYLSAHKLQYEKEAPDTKAVRQRINQLRAQLKTEIVLNSDPEGADVYIDSDRSLAGQTPLVLQLKPGAYRLTLKLAEYEAVIRDIKVNDRPLQLVFPMKKIIPLGRVRVDVNIRGARIFVDGKNIGISPFKEMVPLDEGRHQVVVERDDFETHNQFFRVQRGNDLVIPIRLISLHTGLTWRVRLGYPLLAVGLGVIGGGYFFKTRADLEFQGTPAFDDRVTYQNIGYIGGGVLVATGLALALWDHLRSPIDPNDLVPLEAP